MSDLCHVSMFFGASVLSCPTGPCKCDGLREQVGVDLELCMPRKPGLSIAERVLTERERYARPF